MSKTLIILIALVGGILLGVVAGTRFVDVADVIGTLWLNGLRMTVVPLVVALLITGIAQTADAARAGRLAGRAVLTMLAILWSSSLLAAFMIPTLLMLFPMPEGAADALKLALGSATKPGAVPPFGDFVRAMVPTNPIAAASADAILPLMIFTAAFAFAALRLPSEKRTSITGLFEAIADAMIVIINWVLAIAPIGVFALAFVVGAKAGTAALGALAHYVFILSALGVIIWLASFVLAFLGAAAADRQQRVVDHRLLVRGEPGHVETHHRAAPVQFPERVALEHAEERVGERLDPVGGGVAHLLLDADEVAGQEKAEDLPAPVAERLVAKGPALQKRVERRVGLALVNQGLAGPQMPLAALERLHELKFIARGFMEQLQRPQRTVAAGGLAIGRGRCSGRWCCGRFHARSVAQCRGAGWPASPRRRASTTGRWPTC